MYEEPQGNLGATKGLDPYYPYLNQILRKTIAPKDGYFTNIVGMSRNVLARFVPNATPFCIMGFI